jgi:hypothetical protein
MRILGHNLHWHKWEKYHETFKGPFMVSFYLCQKCAKTRYETE